MRIALTLFGSAALIACGSSVDSHLGVEERRVLPSVVNTRVTTWTDEHFVWLNAAAPGPQLMLLLTGTYGRPESNRLIGRIAAEQGYRVIGLMYPNTLAVVTACFADPDSRCMEKMRAEIIEGHDYSPHVSIDRDNSIDGRLADLIAHLDRVSPGEQWSEFLESTGGLRWDRIAVGGLSQGGGHAAFIAKLRSVPRVIMFGAPADGYNAQVAPWMQLGATPAARYFGFRHTRDPFQSIQPNWIALGLEAFGPPLNVDGVTGDNFGAGHLFLTDALPATGTYDHAHPSVFADAATPRTTSGSPRFESLWRHLLGHP